MQIAIDVPSHEVMLPKLNPGWQKKKKNNKFLSLAGIKKLRKDLFTKSITGKKSESSA